MDELVGSAEIASRLGISRSRVNQLVHQDETFPAAEIDRPQWRLWRWPDIEDWARATGRLD